MFDFYQIFIIPLKTCIFTAFEASGFLGSEEQQRLTKDFDITGNLLGLVSDLRKLVIKAK